MRERDLEKRIGRHVKERGGRWVKMVPTYEAGIPDRLALLPGGRVVFIETKVPGAKLRPNQAAWAARLIRLGFAYACVDSFEAAKALVDSILDGVEDGSAHEHDQ